MAAKRKYVPEMDAMISRCLTELMNDEPKTVKEKWGVPLNGAQKLAWGMFEKAMGGHLPTLKEILERTEGKAKQENTIFHNGKVTFNMRYAEDEGTPDNPQEAT